MNLQKKAGKYYGIELPKTTGKILTDAADAHYSMKQLGLSFHEYFKRVEEIIDALVTLESEHVHERYAKSGRLTV